MQTDLSNLESLLMSEDKNNIKLAIQLLEATPDWVDALAEAICVVAYLADRYDDEVQGALEKLLFEELEEERIWMLQNEIIILDYAQYRFKGNWNVYNSALRHYYYQHKNNINKYIRIFKHSPRRFASLYGILAGRIEDEWSNLQESLFCYETALAIRPDDSSAWFGWAKLVHTHYIQKGKQLKLLPQVIHAYEQAFAYSQRPQCCVELAILHEQQDNWQKSLNYYEQALTLECKKETQALIYNNLANIHLNHTKDYKKARALAQQAYEIDPASKSTLDTLGHIELIGFANYKQAEYWLLKALDLDGKHHYSLTGLGDLYRAQGKYKKALEYYEKGFKSGLNYTTHTREEWIEKTEKLIALLYEDLADWAQAKFYCKKLLHLQPDNHYAQSLIQKMNKT